MPVLLRKQQCCACNTEHSNTEFIQITEDFVKKHQKFIKDQYICKEEYDKIKKAYFIENQQSNQVANSQFSIIKMMKKMQVKKI